MRFLSTILSGLFNQDDLEEDVELWCSWCCLSLVLSLQMFHYVSNICIGERRVGFALCLHTVVCPDSVGGSVIFFSW